MRHWSLAVGLLLPLGVLAGCGNSSDKPPGLDSGGSSAGGSAGSGAGGSLHAGGSTSAGSSSGGSSTNPQGGASTGGSSTAGGTSAGGNSSGGTSPISDAGLADVNFEYDAPIYSPEACAGESVKAEPIPVDMYIVLDDSGSMSAAQSGTGVVCPISSLPGDGSRWCKSINALWGFFNAPTSSNLGVALNYFNNRSGSDCSNALRAPGTNFGVALDTISPGHIATLQASLDTAYPGGQGWTGTPTLPAVNGIISYTENIHTNNLRPGRQQVGVIITDGEPSCGGTNIGDATRAHFAATGIPTFMVGMEGLSSTGWTNIEAWANGSGAPSHTTYCGNGASSCYHYSVGDGDPAVFINVLKEIQKAAVGCTLNIPTPSSGVLDPSTIEVTYTPGGSSTPQTLTRVNNQAACSGAAEFYFDNNTTPTQLNLCPSLCSTVGNDADAEINVEISCLGS